MEGACSGVGMDSLPGRLIGSAVPHTACQCLVMCAGSDADGCTVSTLEPEHSLRSEGDVAVAVALDGRELR